MLVSKGNRKIGNDTLIINITSARDCPSKALGLCKIQDICYAMKAERQYPTVLPYRRRQMMYWTTHTADQIAADFRIEITRKTKEPIKYIRVSEAGDFRNQSDVVKLFKITELLADTGVKIYGYTARVDLDFSKAPSNLTLQGSGFKIHNSFTAIDKAKVQPTDTVCPGNCRTCSMCKSNNSLDIKVINH